MFFKFNLTLLIIAVICIAGTFGRTPQQAPSCKLHGSPCNVDSECCNNAVCHRYAKQCQVQIDANMLQEQHNRLRHVDRVKPLTQPQLSTCKQHGIACVSDSECCGDAVCHRFAQRCQTRIDANMLQAQRDRLRHVDNQYSVHH